MSLYAALYSGVSGLAAYSGALGMISDNIVNINTVGYKETRARFSTLVTESKSTTAYSPGGVQSLPQNLISRQGLLQASVSATDLSIDGAGFFLVGGGTNGSLSRTDISFTRAGSFTPDDKGYLKNTAGLYLLGFPMDDKGNVPINREVSSLQPINIAGLTGTAESTTEVTLRANLQSSQKVNANIATYNPSVAGTSMAGGATTYTPDFQRNIQVFDSQGGTHTLTLGAMKSATPNQWNIEIYANPASDLTTGAGFVAGQVAKGTLAFNTDGTIDTAATSPALLSAMTATWTNGSAPSTLKFNLGTNNESDGFTQFDSSSTLISSSVNGAVFGNVNGVSIGKNGVVTALFDNGLRRDVYKLPLATFQNPDGLTRRQGNSYTRSNQSGIFALQLAGTGGAGLVAPSTLEASTVDLANEFTQLITTQRGFSASTKIITTADEMLDELNRIKR